MILGLDIGQVLTLDQLTAIKAARPDIEMVNPYLDPYNAKGCTPQYLRDIYAAGFKLGLFFFETTGGAGQGDRYFTLSEGRADASAAEEKLAEFKAEGLVPEQGTIVCYADDVRLTTVTVFDEYANGIEQTATAIQTPRVYGFDDLMHYIHDQINGRPRYPNMGKGGVLTYGDPQGLNLDGWQFEQVTVAGITIDLSQMYIPGWSPTGGSDMTDDELRAALKRIYAGPDSLEEWVKGDVRVMVQQDPETRMEVSKIVAAKLNT